ncbi:B12-binding domain-containing radical SAM protein, partial [Acidobacteriota bacterium]
MRILLVNPNQVHLVSRRGKIYNRVWPPLALANCGALLEEQGHEVGIVDANALRLRPDEVAGMAEGYDKVFVSSSSLDRWQCPNLDLDSVLKTVSSIRTVTEEFYILGVHGTVRPGEILEMTQARAVIRGEPELTVVDICRGKNLSEIRGLAYRDNGRVQLSDTQIALDLDMLPRPSFHLLPMDRYHYEVLGSHFTLFEGSRGCASNCTFCLLKMYGTGVRKKSLDRLIPEIEHAVEHHGVRTAYFMDLEFTVFRNQVIELCDYLIKKDLGLRWTCQTRFDLIDPALLARMKRAGCRLIHFGVEAGSDELLRKVNKKISKRKIEEGMRMVHDALIESACFFILGFPDSDHQEIAETVRFAKRLN